MLLTAVLSSAAGANAVAHLWLTQDLASTVLIVIVLLVVAAGITSSPVAATLVGALWLGWFVASAGLSADPDRSQHLSDLAVATLAGLMLHVGRRMTMLKLLRAQAELERLGEHDDLTRLANRRGFFTVMAGALSDAEASGDRLVVLYCDVDGLKLVNDTRGHEAGDMLLVDVAARLREEFTDAEVVARLGGDEFGVVLLAGAGAGPGIVAAAVARAQRIRDDAVEAAWSLSVGAASSDELHPPAPRGGGPMSAPHPHPPDLVGAVVGLADERMYQAKRLRPGREGG